MQDVATDMNNCAVDLPALEAHAQELLGAAEIADTWIEGIHRSEIKKG